MALAELHLALLLSGARHGYDLKQTHDAWFPDARPLAFGQVYSTLARLVRDGLAEVVEIASKGGPERTLYSVTEAGRERLSHWLETPVKPSGASGEELVRKALTLLHNVDAGIDPAMVLAAQRREHLKFIQMLNEEEPALAGRVQSRVPGARSPEELVRHIAHRSCLLRLEAELQWLEEATIALENTSIASCATVTVGNPPSG